ncbi:MAG: hypothetical protein QW258_00745 [Thermoplasmata archaeon]
MPQKKKINFVKKKDLDKLKKYEDIDYMISDSLDEDIDSNEDEEEKEQKNDWE